MRVGVSLILLRRARPGIALRMFGWVCVYALTWPGTSFWGYLFRGLRPEKVVYFVGTDEQAAVVHSRRQRGRAGASRRKPLGGRPRAIIRPSTTLNSVRKQQGIDAMRREQQAKGRAAPQALPTGKCEC